ncbi:MAG: DUF4097 family beta strand repeat protein [Planctomycetes bacterium]|nr:DUF4097 family beta strand repeat protein [Planctomycetota bacterium]
MFSFRLSRRLVPVCLFAIAAGCSYPGFVSRRTIEESVPLDAATQTLRCTSHNGGITITGVPGATEIRMHVELSVHGFTQDEADANLDLMSIRRESDQGELTIEGLYDRDRLSGMSPGFAFVMQVPPALALLLKSHNGDIHTEATNGRVALETHNGNIHTGATTNQLDLVSHNGDVVAVVLADGPTDGAIQSHNGNVVFEVSGTPSAAISARTHNGRIRLDREVSDASVSKRSMSCRIGGGEGRVVLETHNGDITVR